MGIHECAHKRFEHKLGQAILIGSGSNGGGKRAAYEEFVLGGRSERKNTASVLF